MTKITEKQLIESLKQLKEIKPNKEWASLLKSQILAEKTLEPIRAQFSFVNVIENFKLESLRCNFAKLSQISNSRRLAYAFSAILILAMGVFGTIKLLPTGTEPQQTAILTNQTTVVIKEQINATIKNIAQNLKDNPAQTPQTMKILVKTLADMPGDVAASSDAKDLMQTVVESQIVDLKKATLTDEQKNTLFGIEDLYNQGKYTEALEKILLINN